MTHHTSPEADVKQTFALETLYLDLDGVLADFDRGVLELTGAHPWELEPRVLWSSAARHGAFFEELAFMEDALELWEHCRPYSPVILTGLPRGRWAAPQKRAWVARMLGEHVEVITCMSADKPKWSGPGRVLVDDREKTLAPWEEQGGVFIHHHSAAESIAALEALGLTGP